MANPYDPITLLLTGLQTTLLPGLTALTLASGTFASGSLIYGYADPQDETASFPLVAFDYLSSVPSPNPAIQTTDSMTVIPTGDGHTATQSIDLLHYLTLVEFNVWATNASDRATIVAQIKGTLDFPNQIILPDGTTALCKLERDMPSPPEPLRHLYRTRLSYLCEHRLLSNTNEYLILNPTSRLIVNGVSA